MTTRMRRDVAAHLPPVGRDWNYPPSHAHALSERAPHATKPHAWKQYAPAPAADHGVVGHPLSGDAVAQLHDRRRREPDDASPPRATGKSKNGLGEVLLTAAALLGLAVLAITVFAVTTGLKPLVVKSGSMEPTIPTGGMVLVRTIPAAQIEVGDVIAVDRPDNTRVMHRVVTVERRGPTAEVVLKGDANEDVDPVPLVVTEAGELVFSTPVVGRLSAFLASAKGGFVLGSVITAVLLTVVRRRP